MKTKLLLKVFSITLMPFLSMHVSAQWSVARSLYGGGANDGAFAFSIGGMGYVGAGSTDSMLYEYDSVSNKWTNKGATPSDIGRAFSMSFVARGKAYVVGGDLGGYAVSTVYMYDPGVNKWTKMHDFPGGTRDGGFGFSIDGYGYAGGGFDGTNIYSDIWKYDPTADSWTKEPNDIPISGIIFPSCFVINSKAYVLLGGTPPSGVNEIVSMWQFDPTVATWTAKTDFPGYARQAAFAFNNNEYGYAGGGQNNYDDNYYDMWRYDANADKWTASDGIPLFGPSWTSAFVINNTAYVGLGTKLTTSGLVGIDSFYKYAMAVPTLVSSVNKSSMKWALYPNPATDKISINGAIGNYIISIYDETGRKVIQANMRDGGQVSIEKLTPGVYDLQVNENGQISNQQFIKK